MNTLMLISLVTVISYLIGSLSAAILVSRAMGLADPRVFGSGNPGATNVLRSGNRLAAALTLVGDLIKGWLPVVLCRWLLDHDAVVIAAGLGALLGHIYPLYFGFKGGKGIATGFGVLFGLAPLMGMLAAATWLVTALSSRYSSLAALVTFSLAPVFIWVLKLPQEWLGLLLCMAGIVWWRHRTNIGRLYRGVEPKIGAPSSST